jgi:TPR repeat protein
MIEQGHGVDADPAEAIAMYRDLMFRGYVPATGHYGWMLAIGTGVEADVAFGKHLLSQSGEKIAESGLREKKQPKAVLEYYKRAAGQIMSKECLSMRDVSKRGWLMS